MTMPPAAGPVHGGGRLLDAFEGIKARLRAQVEHPFHILKNLFKYRKTRHRGLARNTAQLQTLFGLANRVIAGWRLRARNALRAS